MKTSRLLTREEALEEFTQIDNDDHVQIPSDVWLEILLRTEITAVLDLATIKEVHIWLYDNYFWKRKFVKDFPDYIEICGTELPKWITPDDPMSQPLSFEKLSWRRYYNVIRFMMKRVVDSLISAANNQTEFARLYDLGQYPYAISASRVRGTITRINVKLRKLVVLEFGGFEIGTDIISEDIYGIWHFCQKFLLPVPFRSNGSDISQFKYIAVNDVNIIRTWLRSNLDYSAWVGDTIEFLYDELGKMFAHWVVTNININNMFWYADLHSFIKKKQQSFPNENVQKDIIEYFTVRYNRFIKQYYDSNSYSMEKMWIQIGRTGIRNRSGILRLGLCVNCEVQNANVQCKQCKNVTYCSDKCAKKHWITSHYLTCVE